MKLLRSERKDVDGSKESCEVCLMVSKRALEQRESRVEG